MSEPKVSPARKTISIVLMVIHAIVILGCAASCVFTLVRQRTGKSPPFCLAESTGRYMIIPEMITLPPTMPERKPYNSDL